MRRAHALPSEDDADERSIYAKGPFPADTTLEALQAFFEPFGAVKHIQMRRTGVASKAAGGERIFKGSVFVEFASKAQAEAFLAAWKSAEEGKKPSFGGVPLLNVEAKTAYVTRKRAEALDRRAKRIAEKTSAKAALAADRAEGAGGDDKDGEGGKKAEKKPFDRTITPGCIVKISGLGPAATRE